MKKVFVVIGLVVMLGALGVGIAYAQESQPFDKRGSGSGMGWMHKYMEKSLADVLGISAEAFAERRANGETFYEMTQAAGYTDEEIPELMREARNAAIEAALADSVLTPEQAEWMQSRGFGPGFRGACPMHGDGTNTRRGAGMMFGERGGGRWSQPQP